MALHWSPPVALSKREEHIVRGCKKAKLFVFLRQYRHELFDEAFQGELAAMYPTRARGKEPVAPALLAMVTLLQAALGFSDEDAVEYAQFELRWQMLLDCLGDEHAPFAQGTLFAFRQRLIAHDMDRRLLERTIELKAEASQPPISQQLATLRQFIAQDTEPDPDGGPSRIKAGVAKDRRISVRDGEMRHGRKSKASRVDGYKRHVARDLVSKVIVAVAVTPANRPEAEATDELLADIAHQQRQVTELQIDRGYLAAPAVATLHAAGVPIRAKPFPLRNGGRFTKADFTIDVAAAQVTCPERHVAPIRLGSVARFPAAVCQACPSRAQCTLASKGGRSISIHEQEGLLLELRTRRATPDGRAQLRARVDVEHALAEISRSQGDKARYLGTRNNLFDLRRHAAVANLFTAARAA